MRPSVVTRWRPACACADTSRPVSSVRSKASIDRRKSPMSRHGLSISASTKWPSATRLALRSLGRCIRVLKAVNERLAARQDRACTFTTREAPRSRTCWPALDFGITTFDSSAGGLGGCPFAPGAAGNLATEDLLFMLDGLGIDSGVSIDAVSAASRFIETRIDHKLPSRYLQAPATRSAQ